jgi:hypothetical protein
MISNGTNNVNNSFHCVCGKEYQYASGLSRHKKSCTYTPPCPENTITYNIEEPTANEVDILKTMIFDLIKQNTMLQQNQLEMQTTLNGLLCRIGPQHCVPLINNEINLFLYFQKKDIFKMSKIEK